MINRIILTEKAAELLAPDGYAPRPAHSITSSMTNSHRSQRVLQKINEQVAAFNSGHTTSVRQQKEKDYVLNKLKSNLLGSGHEPDPTPYILNKIDAMATKLSKSSTSKGNVSEYALGSSSAYIQRLQILHDKSMEKYHTIQEKLEQHRAHDNSSFNVEKPGHFDASDTHYKTRFQERLKKQRERKYKGHSQMKLPDVPKKYRINWVQNEQRVRTIKQKYSQQRQQLTKKHNSNTIIAHKGISSHK